MMQNSSKDILSAWHDYVKFSGAEKSKIPASKVHEHQQLMLGINNCEENQGNDSNLLIVFYVQIVPDDFVMQLHRF